MQIIISIIISFIITLVLGPLLIPVLKKVKAGQSIREEGPQSHKTKAGTPTMGGVMIIAAVVITSISAGSINNDLIILLFSLIIFGIVGFIDDFIKVVLKRNLGLRAYQKLLFQIAFAVMIAVYQANVSAFGTQIYIPIVDVYWDFGIFYIPFIAFFVVCMVNSVNLTDGLDGLASGVTLLVALFLSLIALSLGYMSTAMFCGALTGACLGFLNFNAFPAKIFMGDTGSMALGGAIAAAAILMNLTLIIPIVGGIYLIETLSVVLQVLFYKKTGRRLFKMSPLHHHFELSGWKETRVVGVFWGATLVLCIIGRIILMR
ncbi:MAG: phospho-N-acetylmuramoyl-pentapeptide-transferase [Clostridiales bacterium]|nr:phospho-N-acetylmuramoyl-pentapeptide-transferase [Clostridiales bacterium]